MSAPKRLHLIVAGMHRSGTSLVASLFESLGVSMGETFLEPDRNNKKGYFEDLELLEFHRKALTAITAQGETGLPDWGWTIGEQLEMGGMSAYRAEAEQLARQRDDRHEAWGWKDPRTTLLLDFWFSILPDAIVVMPYRAPWAVTESLMRVGAPLFVELPHLAGLAWAFYNQRMLQFYTAHPDRCFLFDIDTAIGQPSNFAEQLCAKLQLPYSPDQISEQLSRVFDSKLLKQIDPSHPVIQLSQHVLPRPFAVLRNLNANADMPSLRAQPEASSDELPSLPFKCLDIINKLQGHIEYEGHLKSHAQVEAQILRGEIEGLKEHVAWLQNERERQSAQIDELEKRLATAINELEPERRARGEAEHALAHVQYERDHLQLVIKSMEATRVWRFRNALLAAAQKTGIRKQN